MQREDQEFYKKCILVGCSARPMSAKELSDSFRIPIGHCYRMIRILLAKRALRCTLIVTDKGRTIPLFKASHIHKFPTEKKHPRNQPEVVQ